MDRTAKANVTPVRQRTQYSCMSASMAMCLNALDYDVTEDEVNRVMGSRPMKGAAWEQALACAQHYGCRATLTMPSTVEQMKAWTDRGVPIMIAWNPEGRPWSHASVVFDVDDDLNVYVADPNIPNPKETVRVISEDEFYGKWYEKFPNYLVRRPACAIEREVTEDGKQTKTAKIVPPPGTHTETLVWSFGRSGWQLVDQQTSKVVGVPGRRWDPGSTSRGRNPDQVSYMQGDPVDWLPKAQIMATTKTGGGDSMQAIWDAWDQLQGTEKVRDSDSFESRADGLFLTVSIVDELYNTKYGRSAEKMISKLQSLERQTRSWRSAYNLWSEGHQIDLKRLAGDLNKTLTSVKAIAGAIALMGQVQRVLPAVWDEIEYDYNKAVESAKATVAAFEKAVLMAKAGKMARKKKKQPAKLRDPHARARAEQPGAGGAGKHQTRDRDVAKGRSRKPKHKKDLSKEGRVDEAMMDRARMLLGFMDERKAVEQLIEGGLARQDAYLAVKAAKLMLRQAAERITRRVVMDAAYSGNPDGKPIYDKEVDHGEEHALSGGFDIMKRVQDKYLVEQGGKPRENKETRLAAGPEMKLRGRRAYVNQAFADKLKKMHPRLFISEGTPRGGFTLIHPASDDDPNFQGGSEYDFYFRPADEPGWFEVGYAPGYLMLLQKDGDRMKAKTTRMARSSFDSPPSAKAADQVARRFVAQIAGNNR